MIITEEHKNELENIYQSLLNDERISKMKEISMHRGSNCYLHSFRVAKLAIKRALRHKKGDLLVILLGSILHDYYLYDWRIERDKMKHHLSHHPYIAAQNAENDFYIPEKVKRVIETHMWPVNIKNFPKTKEARIVSLADKSVCFKEILTSKRFKNKRQTKYFCQIKTLF